MLYAGRGDHLTSLAHCEFLGQHVPSFCRCPEGWRYPALGVGWFIDARIDVEYPARRGNAFVA